MQDPEKLCDNCHHGSDYCVSQCDYFLIKGLHGKYPKETEVLYKKIRKNTMKMINKQEYHNDEDLGEEDDGED